MELRVDEITDRLRLSELSSSWDELCEKDPVSTPFQSPQWLLPWWNNFGGSSLRCAIVKNESELVGLGLFYIYRTESGIRKLCFAGTGISDYLDIISLPEMKKKCFAKIIEYLIDIHSQWDECDLQEIRDDSQLLRCRFPSGVRVRIEKINVCPYLKLPRSPTELEKALPKKLRKNIRHAQRKLRSSETCVLKYADCDSLQFYLGELFRLHGARWGSRNLPGVVKNPAVQSFHLESAPLLLKKGYLRLYAYFNEHREIAAYYVLKKGNIAYAYLGGFDPEMEDYSPGALALSLVIKNLIGDGVEIFDFLRGDEEYKYLWRPKDRHNYRLRLTWKKIT